MIYSGLEVVKDITGTPCPHFDGKGTIEKYLDEIGVPNTSTRYPFYFDNFLSTAKPQKQVDGTYSLTFPMDGPMDGMSVEDGGPAVASIFTNPDEFIGKKVGFSGDRLTVQEYMDILGKITGKKIKYNQVPQEEYVSYYLGAEDMAAMFDFYARGNPDRDRTLTKRLNPAVRTFEQWVTDNKGYL